MHSYLNRFAFLPQTVRAVIVQDLRGPAVACTILVIVEVRISSVRECDKEIPIGCVLAVVIQCEWRLSSVLRPNDDLA